MHRRHEKAQILGQLLAHALDPRQQLAALVAVHQRDQPVTDLKADHVDRGDVIPAQLLGFHGALRRWQQVLLALHLFQGLELDLVLLAPHQISTTSGQQAETQEGNVRHPRHQAHDDHQARGDRQGLGRVEHLPVDLFAHVLGARGAGDHDRGRRGQQQRWQLRHQTVTDGQQGVDLAGIGKGHVVLEHADGHAADQVDEQDQQAGDGVTANKLAGTVHRTVELGLPRHFGTACLGLGLVDQAGVEVGVNGHLLAGHGVEGEARAHLGNTPGALGHHHEVDDHQDREDHDTDHVVTADHHLAEGLDHLTGGLVAIVTVEHHHPRGGDVERQAQ
ncbi:hypothetical protein D3C78_737780 [compost metagenome]